MKSSIKTYFICFAALCLGGCVTYDEAPAPTPVEVQAMQSRTIDCSYKVAYAAVIDVFQELGYIIQNSEFSTGLVVAKSSVDEAVVGGLWMNMGNVMMWRTATAHIEELNNNQVHIRVSFVAHRQLSNEYVKNSERSVALNDAQIYTEFYSKIDNAIFIRKNLR